MEVAHLVLKRILLLHLFVDLIHRESLILLHDSECSLASGSDIHHVLILLTVLALELTDLVAVVGESLDLVVMEHHVQVLSS